MSPATLAERQQDLRQQHAAQQQPLIYMPPLRHDQYEIAVDVAKIKVLAMGRRWGKSVLGGDLVLTVASGGDFAAWVVPTYKNGRKLWNWIENAVRPLRKRKLCVVSRQDRTIDFANGGFFGMYSADNADAIRGESFHLVVVDEAARVDEEVIEDVIIPTLADFNGDLILISTPKGKNWFWRYWVSGQNKKNWKAIRSWHAPTYNNPNPNIKAAYLAAQARAKRGIKVNSFRQEWDAEFVGDGNEVFQNLYAVYGKATWRLDPIKGHDYVIGVDWGRSIDYTVFTIMDLTINEICYYERHQRVKYEDQLARLEKLNNKWRPSAIIAEGNSMGGPLVEIAESMGMPIVPIMMNNASKQALVDDLIWSIDNEAMLLPEDDDLLEEMELYEATKTKTGLTRYAAAGTAHDDIVTTLLLVNQAAVTYAEPPEKIATTGAYTIPGGMKTGSTQYARR